MPERRVAHRPRRVVTRAVGMGIACLATAGLLAWAPAAASGWNQGSAESTLWQLMNGARINNGLAPVQSHGTLVGLARWRSSDMLAKDYFSHTIAGCGCLVYAYYDSNGVAWDWAGENIGWNSGVSDDQSPVRVHEQFMGSAGHRANVLDPRFTHAGVGAAAADNQQFQGYVQNTRMYTELFVDPPSSAPAPAPAPQPASGGGSGGSGFGGGGSGGGGGGGGAATAPVAQQQPAAREPRPMAVRIDRLARPHSSAGIDGVWVTVSRPADATGVREPKTNETAAARVAAAEATRADSAKLPVAAVAAVAAAPTTSMQVSPPAAPEASPFDAIVGGILAFLFG